MIYVGIGKQAAWVFERIGEEVALLENLRELTRRKKTTPISLSGSQDPSKRQWRMHNTDVMGVDLVLRNALEVINLDSSSAKHVIR
jgi:hypothetical protein